MGASGSGKSTLLNILGILDNYDSGEYRIDGKLIWDLTEAKAAEIRALVKSMSHKRTIPAHPVVCVGGHA